MSLFSKKQKDLMETHISTIISDGCKIDGNLSTTTSIRIDGIVNGDVVANQGIIVGSTGKILGNIKASEAVIFGTVTGNIHLQKLEIKSTGIINGDISTQSIEVEFGAVYNGRVKMTEASTNSNGSAQKVNVVKEQYSTEA
ncbi:MAG: polymer-forming cytoskeletal protein [Bacteroidota bacterium]